MSQWSSDEEPMEEWQIGEPAPIPAVGGGMLRQVLDQILELRDGAATDRAALAQAITSSFETFERQLVDLRSALDAVAERAEHDKETVRAHAAEQYDAVAVDLATLRAELDGVSKTMVDSTTQIVTELRQLRSALLGPN